MDKRVESDRNNRLSTAVMFGFAGVLLAAVVLTIVLSAPPLALAGVSEVSSSLLSHPSLSSVLENSQIEDSSKSEEEVVFPINLNTATLAELDALPGIGPVLAQRILEYREANGAFQSPEDLLKVNGIGEKTLSDILDYVVLDMH